jgi:hypothetical protein
MNWVFQDFTVSIKLSEHQFPVYVSPKVLLPPYMVIHEKSNGKKKMLEDAVK